MVTKLWLLVWFAYKACTSRQVGDTLSAFVCDRIWLAGCWSASLLGGWAC